MYIIRKAENLMNDICTEKAFQCTRKIGSITGI